ncbi:hypothetical protein OD91_2123 [Lutibacter sp. Hel_I_33_5]|uniref:transporter n=1 Tax=Lutibacter sp. Hel_I_33_5 TaxID=1566289 RepID=UPI0011A5C5BA|nr:transporter [Lutibacter sp. Hel_I_33_5]TVZ56823.1 hypothetical protein OD91_2123 [Lutibacter sp. Hel_I_33_5]
MKNSIYKVLFTFIILISLNTYGQEDDTDTKSNIQTYTPSKLLDNGQWDIKFFNSVYTQTKQTDSGSKSVTIPRQNFFTSTVEFFTGINDNNRINIGAIVEFRSNTFNGRNAFSVFSFDGRAGLTTIAPAIKWQPLEKVGNFSIQTALHIPTISDEENTDGYLDQTAWSFQNRFFYDYTFPSGNWQIFTELNTEYSFGSDQSFANNTFLFSPGFFLSYFPSNESTILVFTQHLQRVGDFAQNGTSLGLGGKYQLTDVLNLEVLYSKFVRGNNFQGLGNTYSIGLRALF